MSVVRVAVLDENFGYDILITTIRSLASSQTSME